MVGGNYHGAFEPDLYEQYVKVVGKGNVTKSFANFMENTINIAKQDAGKINLSLLQLEIDKIHKQISKLSSELNKKMALKDQLVLEIEEKKQKELQKEKETIENQQKCSHCNFPILKGKTFTFPIGIICQSCYSNNMADNIDKWRLKTWQKQPTIKTQ